MKEPKDEMPQADHSYRVVHLRQAEIGDPAIRKLWQDRGYATLGPMEGHDPYVMCPICSTPEPKPKRPDCPYCGQGPCRLGELLKAWKDD